MCAVIGAIIYQADADDLERVKKLFLESQIRGLHATGISWYKNKAIHTIKQPVSADVFFNHPIHGISLEDKIDENGNLHIIGHCRYSTSDIFYNQPIASSTAALVHNGIITQEDPEKWKDHFGIECTGKNDSELLFRSIFNDERSWVGNDPFYRWPNASFSAITLHYDETEILKEPWITFFRNGKRPIYYAYDQPNKKEDVNCYIFSTLDIGKRAEFSDIKEIKAGETALYHKYYQSFHIMHHARTYFTKGIEWELVRTDDIMDLQHVNEINGRRKLQTSNI